MKSFTTGCALVVFLLLISTLVIPSDRDRHVPSASGRAASEVNAITDSLAQYWYDHKGVYPFSLEVLVTPDTDGRCYLEGYNGKVPLDPWKHEYHYQPPTPEHPTPRVLSFGSDGLPGGEGDAADLDSDDLKEAG